MKLQSMSLRRIMACVLSLLMIITALPLGVSANGGGGGGGGDAPLKVTAEKGIVVGDKLEQEVTKDDANDDGYYTVRINVSGNVGQETIKPNADVILVVDNSGSMDTIANVCNTSREEFLEKKDAFGNITIGYKCPNCGKDYGLVIVPKYCTGGDTRIEIAREVAKQFASGILSGDTENRLSVISFSSGIPYSYEDYDNHMKFEGGWDYEANSIVLTDVLTDVNTVIDNMSAKGGTNYTDALGKALEIINKREGEKQNRPVYVVFITDGAPGSDGESITDKYWNGIEQADAIKKLKAKIYTIGIGIEDTSNGYGATPAKLLRYISSGDGYAEIVKEADVDALNEILDEIREKVNTIYAGTGATLIDVINTEHFEYVPESLTVSDGTSAEIPDGKNITWDIGYITDKVVSLEFKVKLIGDYPNTAGSYNTNDSVLLEYTDPNKEEKSLDKGGIGHPYVIVPEQNVTVSFEAGDGGSFDKDATTRYIIKADQSDWAETNIIPTPVPNDNYYFAGWSLDKDGEIIPGSETGFIPAYGDEVDADKWTERTYYAIFREKGEVTISFKAEVGGKLTNGDYKVDIKPDSNFPENEIPTAVPNEGYIFDGWYLGEIMVSDNVSFIPEKNDDGFSDEWTTRTYTAKFHKNPNYETDDEKNARTINEFTLDIISGSAQKEYDGKPLYARTELNAVLRATFNDEDHTTIELPITVTKNSEDPTDGEWTITYSDNDYPIMRFKIDIFGEQTEVDKSNNDYFVEVSNEEYKNPDKDNYKYIYPDNLLDSVTIEQKYGKLEVTSPIPVEAKPVKYAITFKSGSAEKEYDGSALTCDKLSADATLTMDGGATANVDPVVYQVSAFNYTVTIEYNDTYAIFDVVITGSQTSVGSSKNNFEVDVVKHNFAHGGTIGFTRGTLTVTEEDDDGGFIILPAGFLYIENNVIAPDGFAKDEFTYEVYDNNTGKLVETVTIDANDRSRGVMFAYNTEVYVVPVDMEVEGYNLVTTSDPSDATDDVYVSQDTTIEFTHVYTVQLNTEDHYAYIIGYEDGTVRPQGLITRAEVATIFYRLLSDEARAAFFTQDNNYVDVASDAWYNNAISTMTNAGLFNGYPDGTFNPDGPITRAELVKVAASFFGNFEPGTSVFSDTDGHWASDFIDEAYVLGIVNGYTDGTFKPDQYITRAEAMKIVNGILGRDSVTGDLIDDMVIWSDNLDPDAWYYYIVQEATNSHEYVIDNDEETWTAALPNRDWSELEKVDTEI